MFSTSKRGIITLLFIMFKSHLCTMYWTNIWRKGNRKLIGSTYVYIMNITKYFWSFEKIYFLQISIYKSLIDLKSFVIVFILNSMLIINIVELKRHKNVFLKLLIKKQMMQNPIWIKFNNVFKKKLH